MPEWDRVPAGVAESLCRRLQMDAIATTGSVAIVGDTQPLATAESVAALASVSRRRGDAAKLAITNRTIPVSLTRSPCDWNVVKVERVRTSHDEMIVELSAPIANPYTRNEAGVFARVSLSGEHASWYWVPLVPTGNTWAAGFALVLPM
jgi:hypothetical protein